MLQERGVEEGSATEKAELARWVWQHQHLPPLASNLRGSQLAAIAACVLAIRGGSPDVESWVVLAVLE